MIHKRGIRWLIVGMLTISMAMPVYGSEVERAEEQVEQLEQEKQEIEEQQESLSERLRSIVEELDEAERCVVEKENEIGLAEETLVNAMVDESEQYERMNRRIKYMYENGGMNFWEILCSAESMADFLTRAEYISVLSNRDKDLFESFQEIVKKVKNLKADLQEEYQELTALQSELSAKRASLETMLAENKKELSGLEKELKLAQEAVENAKEAERRKEEEARAAAEAARKAAEEAAKAQETEKEEAEEEKTEEEVSQKVPSVSGNGYFTHPCPGMSYQSSYFGEVRTGIGDPTPHKGHDYAAPTGTPIYAAASGTVLVAGYSATAGYWVVINHGNGLVTKYMHMYASPYVSAGDTVEKGQCIGGVGTTGQSTGNHLHFQVEEYGVAVNPSKYM